MRATSISTTASATTPARRRGPAGYETRECGLCEGSGVVMECGNGPHDRPERRTCSRCEGRGEARVFVYSTYNTYSSPAKDAA